MKGFKRVGYKKLRTFNHGSNEQNLVFLNIHSRKGKNNSLALVESLRMTHTSFAYFIEPIKITPDLYHL